MTTSDKPVMLHIIEISRGNGAKQHHRYIISVDHRNFKMYKLQLATTTEIKCGHKV